MIDERRNIPYEDYEEKENSRQNLWIKDEVLKNLKRAIKQNGPAFI